MENSSFKKTSFKIAVALFRVILGIFGVGIIGIALIFGTGNGLFGTQNTLDLEEIIILISGVMLAVFAVINPITNSKVFIVFLVASVCAIVLSNFQTDTTPVFILMIIATTVLRIINQRILKIR